jgi:hypothetical protein
MIMNHDQVLHAYSGNAFGKKDSWIQFRVGIFSSHKKFKYFHCTENSEKKAYAQLSSKYMSAHKFHEIIYFEKHLVLLFFDSWSRA